MAAAYPRRTGSASSLSASATVSGRRSFISTNSISWIRLTSLAGMGGRLVARQNGKRVGVAVTGVAMGVSQGSAVDRGSANALES